MQTYLFRILCACFLSLSLILTSCSNLLDDTSSSDSDTSRGALSITNITMDSYPVSFMAELIHGDDKLAANVLAATGVSFDNYIVGNDIGILGFAASVNQYNLVYHTIDAKGNATLASAKLLIPDANTDLDLVVYLHGTTSLDSDAPTNAYADFSAYDGVEPDTIIHNIDTMAETAALMGMVASTNTAVLMPDYLGFGASEGLHPYMHGASLASSTIDAIRAALNFANLSSNPFSLTGDFTLTGYSEGGYAVMATHKELLADDGTVESAYLDIMGDSKGSKLKAVIPGAPPCNISQRMATEMLADGYLAPGFAPYVVLAYNEIYDIEANISSIFNPTYNFVIDDFDGTKSITDISTSLVLAGYDIDITDGSANAPIDLFTDTFKTDILIDYSNIFNNYEATLTDDFYQKFKENDVFDYHVGEDVYYEIIYHAADLIVPATNSTDAGDALVAQSSRPLNEFTAVSGSANPDGINLHQDIIPYPIGTTHTTGGSYYLLRSFTVSKTELNK